MSDKLKEAATDAISTFVGLLILGACCILAAIAIIEHIGIENIVHH